ncbi:hypothetical protein [Polyangium jinanense]|uniref:Uncharacterized protein n=1 Tax=Polyangium jinanense TaxID=2829994 RepID=A0A9X4AZ01_9BACT|nr:hypothetical protein [Polyangium jinanense]MDC3958065.1 hypothetical protein [Polyangium jinanense]MDC3989331.1 hypothetical protein [Polyangium jinanense]
MTSTKPHDALPLGTLLGRAVTVVFAVATLLLVLVMFDFRIPYKPGFGLIIVATLLGLGASVWWLGGLAGRAIEQRGGAAVAWGPLAGLATLAITAFSLALASAAQIEHDRGFSLAQAAWDYFGKPFVFTMAYGAIPAALIGLLCAGAIHGAITLMRRAPLEDAP